MRSFSFALAEAALGVLLLAGTARAAEIRIISSDGVASVLDTLKPEYEHATGNTLIIHYGAANLLKKNIIDGEAFDVTILTGEVMDDMIKAGKVVSDTRADIARAGFGIAYKPGSPAPDVHDAASFKATIVGAQSVSYMAQGASGVYFSSLAEKLGFADQLKGKAEVLPSNRVIQAVAQGKAQYGIQVISNIVSVPGVEYVPFPPDLQKFILFSGAAGTSSQQPQAAKSLLKFLTDPKNASLIKTKGMEPG
jgi:molybdate transport system substrate-binding protein